MRRFTKKQLDDLFTVKNWKEYYEGICDHVNKNLKMSMHDWEKDPDLYNWIIYPLCYKEDNLFYRCVLCNTVTTGEGLKFPGVKQVTMFFRTIYFTEFISHCIQYHNAEHKAYIENKFFKDSNVTTTGTSNK